MEATETARKRETKRLGKRTETQTNGHGADSETESDSLLQKSSCL